MFQRRALLLQGDPSIRTLLRRELIASLFQPTDAADGAAAWRALQDRPFDLIVLDSVAGGMDLMTLCRAVRSGGPNQRSAILVVSARGEEAERVLALVSGADDYLTIPFSVPELHARIAALMRRSCLRYTVGHRRAAELTLDADRRVAAVDSAPLPLTRREFNLLYLLMSSPGVVFTREDLLEHLNPRSAASTARLINPLVSRLRAKLKQAGFSSRVIRTVPGVGYTFVR